MSKKKFKRRPNGSGTVYKNNDRKRRKPWIALGSYVDEYGKIQRPYLGSFETDKEADAARIKFQMEIEPVRDTITFSELYEHLYREKESDKLSKSTLDGIRASYLNWEPLHRREFATLMTDHYQRIIDARIESDKTPSLSQLTKDRSLVSQMYDYLNARGYELTNYAKFIKFRGVTQKKVRAYTDEEIDRIETYTQKDVAARVSMILAYTGLRINEFLQLKKFDINLRTGRIHTKGSKTKSGRSRTIPIHPRILPHIKYFLQTGASDSEYLFNRNGKNVSANYYRRNYHAPFMQELCIDLTPHSFRHTAASKFRKAGLTDKAIAEVLGHANTIITDNVYVDLDDSYLDQEMRKVK